MHQVVGVDDSTDYGPNVSPLDYDLMAGEMNKPPEDNNSDDLLKSDQAGSDTESTASHLSSSELAAIAMAKISKKKSSDLYDTYNRARERILQERTLNEWAA